MKFPQQDCLELNCDEAVSVRTRVKQIFLLMSIYFLQFVESGTNCELRLRKWGNNSRNPCHLLRRRSSNSGRSLPVITATLHQTCEVAAIGVSNTDFRRTARHIVEQRGLPWF